MNRVTARDHIKRVTLSAFLSLAAGAAVGLLLGVDVVPTAQAEDMNKCGCYKDPQGACHCQKPAKCGCPGDCEPASCEAKRQAAEERENRAALKRIAERERKTAAEAKKAAKNPKTSDKPAKAKDGDDEASPQKKATDRELEQILGVPAK